MNGPVDAAPAEQARVRGVDDGVGSHLGDVALDQGEDAIVDTVFDHEGAPVVDATTLRSTAT